MVIDLTAAMAFFGVGVRRFVGHPSVAAGVVLLAFLSFGFLEYAVHRGFFTAPVHREAVVIVITMRSPRRSWRHRSSLTRSLRSRSGNCIASCVRRPPQPSSSSGFMSDTITLRSSAIGSTMTAHQQIRVLTNARSITARLFTRSESAENHCQVRSYGLAFETIIKWLEGMLVESA
jgi:hypothetical protein